MTVLMDGVPIIAKDPTSVMVTVKSWSPSSAVSISMPKVTQRGVLGSFAVNVTSSPGIV